MCVCVCVCVYVCVHCVSEELNHLNAIMPSFKSNTTGTFFR